MHFLDPRVISKTGPMTACTEASTAGFPVGRWPKQLSLGLFEFTLARVDSEAAKYVGPQGAVLTVFND